MLTPYLFFVSVLHTLPFSNSILIALFIFFFADWRKNDSSRALLLFFIVHAFMFLSRSRYEFSVLESSVGVFDFFGMFYVMLITPLLYNFIYAFTTGHCMRWKRWLAFYLPLALLLVAFRVAVLVNGAMPLVITVKEFMAYWPHPEMIIRSVTFVVRIIYGTIMIVGTYLNYKRYESDLGNDFSNVSSRSARVWMSITIFFYIIYFTLSVASYLDTANWLHLLGFVCSVILNVSLAFFAYSHRSVYSRSVVPLSQIQPSSIEIPLDDTQYEKMHIALTRLCVRDQIWKNSDLTATDVIFHLNTNRTYFSKFLQDVYKTNFRTCINTYRVSEAQKMIRENPNMNMIDIYVQCGFASSSSFNEWFKKITGKSPSEYKEEL